ncbi:MAG: glucose-6-phosphate isomerase [Pseudomonadota bacterium]|nr:glucose-6-phosphate isomerase [Pseudomonadota bacterium]
MSKPRLTTLPAWSALQAHFQRISKLHLRDLFDEDKGRFERLSLQFNDLFVDYSKNRMTDETLKLLTALAAECHLDEAIQKMFSGCQTNTTEQRAVLHVALRNRSNTPVMVGGKNVMPDINRVLEQMQHFTEAIHNGVRRGFTGDKFTDIVNIGIGGSDLGPHMVTTALKPYWKEGINAHFVSNVDGSDMVETLNKLNPGTTLFIIASKTFTTRETMTNAHTARHWFLDHFGNNTDVIKHHFVAVSTNTAAVRDFGIDTSNMFEFWDWVGGRYSLWSAIGLPIALTIGMENFKQLLMGAHEMDLHFRSTPFEKNLPVLMAMIGIWYRNFFAATSHVILPYDHTLRLLPAYLQQADMESNGKRVTIDGESLDYDSGPIIWGQPGTNGQHAFYQLIHQGTQMIPADFIIPLESHNPIGEHHTILLSNCLAQTEALMKGKTAAEVARDTPDSLVAHKVFPGNKPSNTVLINKLTPRSLGSLVSLYEHKIFVQGVIWGINSFDQWGVELGKQLAGVIEKELESDTPAGEHDSSTAGLIDYCRKHMP